MNDFEKPREIPEKPVIPEIRPDTTVPEPDVEPEHPVKIVPEEEPEKKLPPEINPEK